MRFDWDPEKAHANRAKHGIDFADAVAVFEDALAATVPDPDARGEARYVTLGRDCLGRLVVVVHAERDDAVRVISARIATRRERRHHEG